MTRTEWLVEFCLGPCRCIDTYKSRDLRSPSCGLCTDGESVREALLLSYQLGHDEKNAELVEGNREALSILLATMEIDLEMEAYHRRQCGMEGSD